MQVIPIEPIHGEVDWTRVPALGRDPRTGQQLDQRGIPFGKNPGLVTPNELKGIKYKGVVHVRTFNMNEPVDVVDYLAVRQMIFDKKALLLRPMLVQYIADMKGWLHLMEWVVLTAELVKQRREEQEAREGR